MNNFFTLPPFKLEQVFTAKAVSLDWGLQLLGVPELWRKTQGEGVKVAVLDTGVAAQHPDLVDAIADTRDFTGSSSGTADVVGHGTCVSGIIGARDNHCGVVGVAPRSKIIVGKIIDDSGVGQPSFLANSLRWAVQSGAEVICMSLGCGFDFPEVKNAIAEASKHAYLIAAAGNEGPDLNTVTYPARYPEVLAVGAIDRRREIAKFSSRGEQVDIVAPGDSILTTYPQRGMARMTGTSMAAPLVAGIVALIVSVKSGNRIGSHDELLGLLRATAIDLGKPGHDTDYGWGLIDPRSLIK